MGKGVVRADVCNQEDPEELAEVPGHLVISNRSLFRLRAVSHGNDADGDECTWVPLCRNPPIPASKTK